MRFHNPTADEMKRVIRSIGYPIHQGEQTPDAIKRAARLIGLTARKTRSYWYSAIERPDPIHYEKALHILEAKEAGRHATELSQIQALRQRLDALQERAGVDRASSDRSGSWTGRLGDPDSPVAG